MQKLRKSILLPIFAPAAIFFLWINFVSTQTGGYNAMTRMMTLYAILEDGTFQLDPYLPLVGDWTKSRHTDHYYSNKAPAPVILALPLYIPLHYLGKNIRGLDGNKAPLPAYLEKTGISFLTQVFPMVVIAFFLTILLRSQFFMSPSAEIFFLLSLLHGSTTALLWNSFFGHGMAALFLLASYLFLKKERLAWSALCFSLAAFSDYYVVALAPFYLFLLGRTKVFSPSTWKYLFLGALPIGLVWAWYHQRFFGSPFSLPMSHISPVFVPTSSRASLWGVIGLVPSLEAMSELLWGGRRGLLVTQPWIPILGILSLLKIQSLAEQSKQILFFTVGGLGILFYLNSSFDGWHGGGAPGPRYLAAILPFFSLLAVAVWNQLSRKEKFLLWGLLAYTIIFRIVVGTGSILVPPEEYLWTHFLDGIYHLRRGSEGWKLLAILVGALGSLAWALKSKWALSGK